MSGTVDDPALSSMLKFTKTSAGYGQKVTKAYADAYRLSHARVSRLTKPPRDPVSASQIADAGKLLAMDWKEYSRRVRSSAHHNVGGSLALIAIARRWFADKVSFARFSEPERKAIAGILGRHQKENSDLDRDWGWFGSMRGAGDFANRIRENDRSLARAIDSIPLSGEVTRAQYDRYCELFKRAFK